MFEFVFTPFDDASNPIIAQVKMFKLNPVILILNIKESDNHNHTKNPFNLVFTILI